MSGGIRKLITRLVMVLLLPLVVAEPFLKELQRSWRNAQFAKPIRMQLSHWRAVFKDPS